MKSLIACTLALMLTACASAPAGPYNPIAAQCDYESDVATMGIPNPIMSGIQKVQMFNKCMQMRRAS